VKPLAIDISTFGSLPRPRQRLFARAVGNGFDARPAAGVTVIELFDEIGPYGITAKAFAEALRLTKGGIVLRINSPGGSVFDGLAIFNTIVAHRGPVRVEILGVAASAASLVAMAGDEIAIAENAFVMVHRSWGMTLGNTIDHADMAAMLAKVDGSLAGTYASRTGRAESEMMALMDAETWLKGEEVLNAGFATKILPAAPGNAQFDLSVYSRVPPDLKASSSEPARIASEAQLERLMRDRLQLSQVAAKKMARAAWPALAPESVLQWEALATRVAAATNDLRNLQKGTTK
jgi:ATP-dependent protease ClpP protease subunit